MSLYCVDPDTVPSNCRTGDIQLNGTIDEVAGTIEGRVEICINNVWGTVCDNLFGPEDAGATCVKAGGFSRES